MRKLGLIGGMSWASTALYYEHLNKGVARALGGLHSARVITESVDFAHVAAAQTAGDWEGAIEAYDRVRARTGDHDAVLLANLAWARFEAGDAPGALPHATRANAIAPRNGATADARGWMLLKTGRDRATALALLGRAWNAR